MFTADWALRRVLKFVLKRSLGRYLQTDLDLEQLDVQLGSGAVELRNALLNCDSINQRLVGGEGWEGWGEGAGGFWGTGQAWPGSRGGGGHVGARMRAPSIAHAHNARPPRRLTGGA
jgi:hypothetical protein